VSLRVLWHPPAEDDLRQIPWQDAAAIVREVDVLAERGVGDVRVAFLPSGRRVFLLMLTGIRVVMTFDRPSKIVHVWEVRRSQRR